MNSLAQTYSPLARLSDRVYRKSWIMVLFAAILAGAAALVQGELVRIGLMLAGGVILALLVLSWALSLRRRNQRAMLHGALKITMDAHTNAQLYTDMDGCVLFCNQASDQMFGDNCGHHISALLDGRIAVPDTLVFRVLKHAQVYGKAQEKAVSQNGALEISVASAGDEGFLWTITEDRKTGMPTATAFQRLPMMTVGRTGAILFMNSAARALFGQRKKNLAEIGAGEELVMDQINVIETADGPRHCVMVEFEASAGRREVFFQPVDQPPAKDGFVVLDELPVPLLKVTRDGVVVLANRSARRLVGQEITPTTLMSDLMEGLGRSIKDWLAEDAAGHGNNHSEFLRLKRNDKEIFVQVTLNRVHENGEVSLIAVLNDATELKTLEAQFVQSQKMQAIGQLAGGVAHDFNNLLTAISGHCDLLLLRHDQGDSDYADLVQINQNANRAAALVGQLLAFSRKQNLRPEVLDLRDTLADLTHLLNRLVGEKVSLTLSHDPVLPAIRADKRQLEQVIMNLVVNARDAMPDGGEIRIQTDRIEITEPMTRDRVVVPPGSYVSVQVVDEGTGIAPDKLQKVFEPFYTTKRTGEGTGLGLSTAYGIVKQTGGYIFVDSMQGEGTTFTLLFSVHDHVNTPAALPEKTEDAAPAKHGEGVVLLVEDEAPVRAFASRALRLRGYTVLEADCAEAALEILEDGELRIDLFVSDVIMPGMDGPTWVNMARETRPDTRVIFVSGYAEDAFSDNQAMIPNSVFLPKPFSLTELTEMVQSQMQKVG